MAISSPLQMDALADCVFRRRPRVSRSGAHAHEASPIVESTALRAIVSEVDSGNRVAWLCSR